MMAISLVQALILTHPSNCVFDCDPALGKRAIEAHVFGWPIFAARFAPWRRAQPFGVQLRNPHVGQITDAAHTFTQARQQVRLFEQRDIGGRPGHTVGAGSG